VRTRRSLRTGSQRQYVDRTSVTPAIHRLRNRDSELCNPRRADSADWSITLGWPSVDRYYLTSTLESFALAPHFLLVSLSLSFRFFLAYSVSLVLSCYDFLSLFFFSYPPLFPPVLFFPGFYFRSFRFLPRPLTAILESLFFWISREKCCLTHYCPCTEFEGKNIAKSNRLRV